MIGRFDGNAGIARLGMDERKKIVAKREVGTEPHGLLQLAEGLRLAVAQPERSPHRPVCRRILIVDEKALARRLEGAIAFSFAVAPALESALPMCE